MRSGASGALGRAVVAVFGVSTIASTFASVSASVGVIGVRGDGGAAVAMADVALEEIATTLVVEALPQRVFANYWIRAPPKANSS